MAPPCALETLALLQWKRTGLAIGDIGYRYQISVILYACIAYVTVMRKSKLFIG